MLRRLPRGLTAGTVGLLLLLAGLFAAERWSVGRLEASWGEIAAEKSRNLEAEVVATFDAFQGGALESVRSAAASVLGNGGEGDSDRARLFDLLGGSRSEGLTLEYYDASGKLLAWNGPRGPEVDPARLAGGTRPGTAAGRGEGQSSTLLQGPIYTYLVIVIPVFRHDSVAGRVVGKRLFSSNHPVNNRFVTDGGLAGSFQSLLQQHTGASVSLRIRGQRGGLPGSPEQRPAAAIGESAPGGQQSASPLLIPLRDISGAEIGYVVTPRPDRTGVEASLAAEYAKWEGLAALTSLVLILLTAGRLFLYSFPRGAVAAWTIASIWIVRYAMVALDIPGGVIGGDLFDPTLFASSFGYGIARSLGDLLLSALSLTVSMVLLDDLVSGWAGENPDPGARGSRPRGIAAAASLLGLLLLIGLLGPLSRGFYAIIQSAVFDSRIDLNDPKLVFPGLPMAVLLMGIMLLIYSSILAGVLFLTGAVKLIRRAWPGTGSAAVWTVVALLTMAGSILFDLLHPNPLGTPWGRLLMFGGLIVLAIVTAPGRGVGPAPVGARSRAGALFLIALAAVGVMIPLLDEKVHEHDRTVIEAAVRDLARPEDAWMTYLVGESLTDMSDTVSADILLHGDRESVERLAFTAWARSVIAGEGNNCSVTFIDREGSVVSYFHVGLAPHWSREHHMDEMPRSTRFLTHETRMLRGRLTSWYKGYDPVFASDGTFAGGVWLGSSPNGPEKIFGEDADLLALFPKTESEAGVRKVVLAEYYDGRLLSASADDIPWGRSLAGSLPADSVPRDGVWAPDRFGGRNYETFYLPTGERSVIGVSLESLDFGWHFYSYSRYLIFFFVALTVVVVAYALRKGLGSRAWKFSFRSKLIAAFAIVSIIPVVLLAYYNRQSSQADAAGATADYLKGETDLVLSEIQEGMGMSVPYELGRYSDIELEDLAAAIKTDFTLYAGPFVQGSSRPELFSAELIDPRISAGAYSGIYLSGMNFYMEEQSIGTLSYLVGYRPIRSPSGEVIGAVSVPALSRQSQVEEILAKDDVLLYGIYILVLGVALLIGSFIANQISRPVSRLTAAARRVATGDLEVELQTGRGDELGELESAFQAMTSDLKEVQERIVRAERELAWKEMARQVAHEIRNPLTPMRLSLQHLQSAYRKNAADFGSLLEKVSATVLEQIDSLNRIATEFSGFARFPERRLTVCDLHEVLREAIALHAQGGVTFIENFTPDPVGVTADREELRRAFINIVRNSVQAARGRVRISVSTSVRDGTVEVVIADDGPGMTPEVQARLFEPNFSTKTDGMGLGLTIVRKIVAGLGGEIAVRSTPGSGTTVTVSLPLAEGESE